MSYCIDYAPDSDDLKKHDRNFGILFLMTLTVFVLFLSYVRTFRPEVWTSLQEWVWPGDAAVTKAAVEALLLDLRAGIPATEAAAAFCTEILHHAGIR